MKLRNRPMVHYAKQLESEGGGYYTHGSNNAKIYNVHGKREVFIIENPPKDRDEIIRIIAENEKFVGLNKDYISWTYDTYSRCYYRASWNTPLDFVEYSSILTVADLSDHNADLICKITMEREPINRPFGRDSGPDSLRCVWTCNCTDNGDTIVEYHSVEP